MAPVAWGNPPDVDGAHLWHRDHASDHQTKSIATRNPELLLGAGPNHAAS